MNIVVPLAILRLAARRHRRSLRLLLAVPIALAVPLAMFRFWSGSSPVPATGVAVANFAWSSLRGLPVLAYLSFAALTLVRRRWRGFAGLIALTVITSVVLVAGTVGLVIIRRSWGTPMHSASNLHISTGRAGTWRPCQGLTRWAC
jgi:hypothetical protein